MAAKRFTGKYSPDPSDAQTATENPFRHKQVARVSLASKLLYIPAAIMLVAALREVGDNAGTMLLELGAFVSLALGAWLLNEGLKAEHAYDDRKVARPPAIPRKAFAACLAGVGVVAGYLSSGDGLISALIFGTVAAAAHAVGFGLDPMRKKGLEGHSDFDADRVARAVEKAETLVKSLTDAAARIGDRGLEDRVSRLANSARAVFRTVEEDPRDLPRARKFMSVYLSGARDATAKFADIYTRNRDPEARQQYEALLSDLETSFTEHREALLADDRSDLDIEIEVLRERLQYEVLKPH